MKHPPRNVGTSAFNWRKLILQTDLPSNAKYLALYLSTYMNDHQDMAWPSLKRIEGETGLAHATVIKWLTFLCDEGWLTKVSGSRTESNKYFVHIPDEVGQPLTYVNQREKVGQPLTSNNNRITNTTTTKAKRFKPPTIEEVKQYAIEKKFTVDADYFFEFYTTAKWRDAGDKPVKNWKLKLLTWNKREEKSNGSGPIGGTGQARVGTGGRKQTPAERLRAKLKAEHGRPPEKDISPVA